MKKQMAALAFLFSLLIATTVTADDYDNHTLYQEFMGYAQEYYQDAEKHEALARLFRQMGDMKE